MFDKPSLISVQYTEFRKYIEAQKTKSILSNTCEGKRQIMLGII